MVSNFYELYSEPPGKQWCPNVSATPENSPGKKSMFVATRTPLVRKGKEEQLRSSTRESSGIGYLAETPLG